MNSMVLETYLDYFLKLKRANGNAPHKPILLLSVFQAIQSGLIDNPFFKAEPELVSLYNSNFYLYVKSNHSPNFTMPFTKMDSEPFWKVIFKKEFENINTRKTDIKSFVGLNNMIFGVQIDLDLFNLLIDKHTNERICQFIVNKYFLFHYQQ
jgi:putative restriction endonuclease